MAGHEATDTGLAYAPVSQAHGHHHTQFNVLPCCTAARYGRGGGCKTEEGQRVHHCSCLQHACTVAQRRETDT